VAAGKEKASVTTSTEVLKPNPSPAGGPTGS